MQQSGTAHLFFTLTSPERTGQLRLCSVYSLEVPPGEGQLDTRQLNGGGRHLSQGGLKEPQAGERTVSQSEETFLLSVGGQQVTCRYM